MLMGGDFDLNSMQIYADPLKKVLKQTMLNQEVIFRKQVHELHRLYRIQKALMEGFGWKDFDGYNLWKMSTRSTVGPFINPWRFEHLAEEKIISTIPTVSSTDPTNNDYLKEHTGTCFRLQQGALDLELPADHFINYIGAEFLSKENGRDSLRHYGELRNYIPGDNASPPEELKLSLSIGVDARKSDGKRTWHDKIREFSSQHVIDLEESTEKVSNEASKPESDHDCAPPITYSGDKHDSQVSVQSNQSLTNSAKKEPSCGFTVIRSVVDTGESCQEQNSFNKGIEKGHSEIACNNYMFSKEKQDTSYEMVHLDLNRVLPDDSSFFSNDPALAYPSSVSSSGNGLIDKFHKVTPAASGWRKPAINWFDGTSALLPDDAVNPISMDSNSNSNGMNNWARSNATKVVSGSEVCPIDLESVTGPPSDIGEDLGSHSRDSENENLHSPLKFPNENHADVALAEVHGEKVEEDMVFVRPCRSQSAVQDGHTNILPVSFKFNCIADNNSCSVKTMQSGTYMGESNLSPPNKFPKSESSQVVETPSCEQDRISSDSIELNHQCSNKKKEELTEVDDLIQKAAESLIHISLQGPTSTPNCFAKARLNEFENEEREQPQYSSDSFASIVLKLKEQSADDDCVSSQPFEVNETDKRDCGIKLRRGRRLKDFQRDVLPSLASLSRLEIREDINIMEGVLRSREYKKMRSKMAAGDNWFAPVKSRRSRLNYVGRRYYS
ncbi:uncharacterized protein LOC132304017 isoform X2 [Cornus florida]|uniref:uncharacterized protein LOC132304017 isoform X2 n=1 Tax=Cornus florida TaxID=4283 RepID=UPI00289DFE5F|nr:uncharacterized protein LOC132304017 isoform X2 [Cornus florida]